jgi:uncharacterized membrane protein
MRKSQIFILAIIFISILISFIYYPKMPENIASHWDINGNVNGYSSKFWGIALFPILLIILGLMFFLIPKIDPLKENIKKFIHYFDGLIILLFLFLLLLEFQVILWNIGIKINPVFTMPISFAIIFFYIGILLGKTKRNWSIGIRTPWTVSNDLVWDSTHKLGAVLFKIAGLLCFLGLIFQKYAFFIVLLPVIIFSIYLVIYSFFEYERQIKKIKKPKR